MEIVAKIVETVLRFLCLALACSHFVLHQRYESKGNAYYALKHLIFGWGQLLLSCML